MQVTTRFFSWLLVLMLLLAATFALAAPTTPTEDFTDNLDGTVTHRTTGLTWMRCAMGMTWDGTTCTGIGSTYTWDEATKMTANFAGKTDWRLPSIAELQSIMEREWVGVGAPLNNVVFPNAQIRLESDPTNYQRLYWSSTATFDGTYNWAADSWGASFLFTKDRVGKDLLPLFSRLVRSSTPQASDAQFTPTENFIDHGDGTTTHITTGLMWKRCAEGQNWNGVTCSGIASSYDWATGTTLSSSTAGFADWRLPNENELLTIVEYKTPAPSINKVIFPKTLMGQYLSASAPFYYPDKTWCVNFASGAADFYCSRNNALPARLVRRGNIFSRLGFSSLNNVLSSSLVQSNSLKVAGIASATPIAIVGGSYSINGGNFTSVPGMVYPDDTVRVQVISAAIPSVAVSATLTIGEVNGSFTVITSAMVDSSPPTVPSYLSASFAENSANLDWGTSSDNVGVSAYRLYRDGRLLIKLSNATTFIDKGLSAGVTYRYEVAACDAVSNCSDLSAPAVGTLPVASLLPPTEN